jgi:hypothetical protein
MVEDRSRYGLVVAALGAILLAISVFLPWYGVSFTASGIAEVQRLGERLLSSFGNAIVQGYAVPLRSDLGSLAGQPFASVSGRAALGGLSILLLVLAALALLDSLLPLARTSRVPAGAGGALVLLGLLAAVIVLFRIVVPPSPMGSLLALSPREGAWLALLGSIMVVAGGAWPRVAGAAALPDARAERAWAGLSGWTPQG